MSRPHSQQRCAFRARGDARAEAFAACLRWGCPQAVADCFAQVGGESVYTGYGAPIVDQGFEWRRASAQSGTISR
jgi:hypothetical protein